MNVQLSIFRLIGVKSTLFGPLINVHLCCEISYVVII